MRRIKAPRKLTNAEAHAIIVAAVEADCALGCAEMAAELRRLEAITPRSEKLVEGIKHGRQTLKKCYRTLKERGIPRDAHLHTEPMGFVKGFPRR